jgi:hypothetical protein
MDNPLRMLCFQFRNNNNKKKKQTILSAQKKQKQTKSVIVLPDAPWLDKRPKKRHKRFSGQFDTLVKVPIASQSIAAS